METRNRGLAALLALGLLGLGVLQPAGADLTACIGTVGFAEQANLERSPAFGIRWGKSSGMIGGETSLLIARPERELPVGPGETSASNATALFYEARLLVSIPMGQISPFAGVGLGQILVTSTDVEPPAGTTDAAKSALKAAADLQTNNALSYGAGVRYSLNSRLYLRADLRQYVVFSVAGVAKKKLAEELEAQTGVDTSQLTDDDTVQYDEFSVGVSFAF